MHALSRFWQYADVINRGYIGPHGRKYTLFEGDDTIMEIGYACNLIIVRKALGGVDFQGRGYDDYPEGPKGMVKGEGYRDISIEEAKVIF